MTTTLKADLNKQLEDQRTQLAASLAAEKLIEVPPPSTWDAWPAGYTARRNWRVGYSNRCRARRLIKRKIRTLKALIKGGVNVNFNHASYDSKIVRDTFAAFQADEKASVQS
jgi:hypothetical protein